MSTYENVKERIQALAYEKRMTINKLSTESAVSPSTIKTYYTAKVKTPELLQ